MWPISIHQVTAFVLKIKASINVRATNDYSINDTSSLDWSSPFKWAGLLSFSLCFMIFDILNIDFKKTNQKKKHVYSQWSLTIKELQLRVHVLQLMGCGIVWYVIICNIPCNELRWTMIVCEKLLNSSIMWTSKKLEVVPYFD